MRRIVQIALLVRDYDEAIDFYVGKLNFILVEDSHLSESKRWVVISPDKESEFRLLLAKAANEEQLSRVGNQTGGRVFLFMHTNDFRKEYAALLNSGIEIVRSPAEESWGTVAVFKDLYGNLWDLIEPKE